jgi:hypothetical protein
MCPECLVAHAAMLQRSKDERRARGVCVMCGDPVQIKIVKGSPRPLSLCARHAEKQREATALWHLRQQQRAQAVDVPVTGRPKRAVNRPPRIAQLRGLDNPLAKNFKELQAKMSPERQQKNAIAAQRASVTQITQIASPTPSRASSADDQLESTLSRLRQRLARRERVG